MGVVSNKVDITELQKGGGGTGDLPGRVTALEAETVELAEGLALVQTSVRSGRIPMQTGDKIAFGVDGDGNYGYYKAGADTVTPFLTGGGGANKTTVSVTKLNQTIQISYTDRPKYVYVYSDGLLTANSDYRYVAFLELEDNNESYTVSKAFGCKYDSGSLLENVASYLTISEDKSAKTITVASTGTQAANLHKGTYHADLIV